jgi:hypothetical protein
MADWEPPASDFAATEDAWRPPTSDFSRHEHNVNIFDAGVAARTPGGRFLYNWLEKPALGVAQNVAHLSPTPGAATTILDQFIASQKARYDAERKARGDTGIDWAGFAGSVLSPPSLAFGALGKGLGATAAGLRKALPEAASGLRKAQLWTTEHATIPALVGAGTAASQPTTGTDYRSDKAAQAVGGAVGGAILGPLANYAVKGVDALKRVSEEVGTTIRRKAIEMIGKAYKEDQELGYPSAEAALKAVTKARSKGIPQFLSDVNISGPTAQQLSQGLALRPGGHTVAQGQLRMRDTFAPNRMVRVIREYLKEGANTYEAVAALQEARISVSRPLYEQAEKIENIWSPELERILQKFPVVRQYFAKAIQSEGMRSIGGQPMKYVRFTQSQNPAQDPEAFIIEPPNLRTLDLVKRGMDRYIRDMRRAGRLDDAADMNQLKDTFVAEVDRLDTSGVYKKARDAWAGHTAAENALHWGENIFKNGEPAKIAAEFNKMSASEKEFARLGVANTLRKGVFTTSEGADETRKLLNNPWMEMQLRPVFGTSEKFRKFVDAVSGEHEMKVSMNKYLAGSPSVQRLVAIEDASEKVATAASAAGHGMSHHMYLGLIYLARLVNKLRPDRSKEIYAEAAKQMFGARPNLTPVLRRDLVGGLDPFAAVAAGNVAGEVGRGPSQETP